MKRLSLLILLMVALSSTQAQSSYNQTHTASVSVGKISDITITSTNSVEVLNTVDYETGTILNNFWTVQVYANSNWQVTIASATANFQQTAVNTVPVSILSFRKNGTTTWKTLSTTNQIVATGSTGDNTVSGNNFGIDLRVIPTFNYQPGLYTVTINITSTAL